MSKVDKFIELSKKSHFYWSFYTADIDIEEFIPAIMFFINRPYYRAYDKGERTLQELIDEINKVVPEFQRDNDKWTRDMQSSYLSNIVQGCKAPPLILYTIGPRGQPKTNCFILDGLQRITTMIKLFTDETLLLSINDGEMTLTSGELMKDPKFVIHLRGITQSIRIYDFDNEIQAVKHYISINENMTHSPEDITRARTYLEKLEAKENI
jgi:hypothetical protein